PLENERDVLSGNGDLAATDEKEASPEESSEVSGGSDSETVKGISPEAASKKALEPSLSQAGMPENGKESEGPTASSAFISPAAVASENSADVTSTEKDGTEAASGDMQAAVTGAGSTHSNYASSNEPNSTAEAEPAPSKPEAEGYYSKKKLSPEKKLEEAYIRRMAKRQRPLKTSSFFWTEFLLLIPGINLVLLFVWAFRKNANANRKAFARSILIWILILILFLLIVLIVMIVLGIPVDKYIWLKSFQDWAAGLTV
ncbi:MAG: hypothetical protein ACLUFA_12200, partial [[Clostridium] leptum]